MQATLLMPVPQNLFRSLRGAILARDTFTRADGTGLGDAELGGTYQTDSTNDFLISSNRARASATTSGDDFAYLNLPTADVDISLTVTVPAADSAYAGIVFRYLNATNYLRFGIRRNTAGNYDGSFAKVVANVSTSLGSISLQAGSTVVLRVVAKGPDIKVYTDGALRATASESFNQTQTGHGLFALSSAQKNNNFFDNLLIRKA